MSHTIDLAEAESPPSGGRWLSAGAVRLDLQDERLWRDGAPVRLGGKAFALLRVLMGSPQTLVTKDELFERVWPGLTVSESVLTTAVKELRQALGDDARRPSMIETVHGRGYRFLLPVARDQAGHPGPAAAPRPRSRAWVLATLAPVVLALAAAAAWIFVQRPTMLGLPHPKSVAVLPFAALSPGAADRLFAEGLTEEVQSTLARTADLRVAARGSVAVAGDGDLRRAARAAGVAHVLTGSVRRSGERLRVTVELVRASDGVHIWSQSYDRSGGDIISIQEDIGVRIAQALRTATDPDKLRAMAAAGTSSAAAYEAYLRGLAFERRLNDEGDVDYGRAAGEAYEEARRLDPGFAAAHWRAAQRWFGNFTRIDVTLAAPGATDGERLARFFERVDAAIGSSRDETDTLKYRAARAVMQLRFRQAQQLMASYLEARPRDIDAWEEMTDLAAYAGDRRAMAHAARRVHELSVEAGDPRSRAITVLSLALRPEEALAVARSHLEHKPNAALTLYQAHRAAIWAGRMDEARRYLARLQASSLPAHNKRLAGLRQACAEERLADAAAIYRALASSDRANARVQAAQIYGDEAAAVRALAPLDAPERLPTLMQFLVYPSFDPRPFPNLSAALAADGVRRPPATPVPHGCRR